MVEAFSNFHTESGLNFLGKAIGVRFGSQAATATAVPVKEAAKPSNDNDDDDYIDLFGEETKEEKKAVESSEAAEAFTKNEESGKSPIFEEVKPWDDENGMNKLEEDVRSFDVEGLLWGACKLVLVGYGKQIMLTIIDKLVSYVNNHLSGKTCISRGQLTKNDIKVYGEILEQPSSDIYPNVSKWYHAVSAKLALSFPGKAFGVRFGSQTAPSIAAPAKEASKPSDDNDDDDDINPFGEETKEEKKAAKEREAAKASTTKKFTSIVANLKDWTLRSHLFLVKYLRAASYQVYSLALMITSVLLELLKLISLGQNKSSTIDDRWDMDRNDCPEKKSEYMLVDRCRDCLRRNMRSFLELVLYLQKSFTAYQLLGLMGYLSGNILKTMLLQIEFKRLLVVSLDFAAISSKLNGMNLRCFVFFPWPIEWEEFAIAFINRVFPLELREAKVFEFINLKQDSTTVKEYSLNFTQLSRYALHVIVDSRSKMSKFVSCVSDSVVKDYRTIMLIKDMDLVRLMVHAQQIEEQKTKEKERENKRARIGSFSFAQPMSESGDLPQFYPKSSVPAPSSTRTPVPKFRYSNKDRETGSKSQGSVSSARTNLLC
ncbi:Elongation factor 1-beta 1 [Capsicum baccatum]|uniref:Elongation factor 1-beta 1 n=1 Tax=Capsicum baccatum TaxID=33114 RepID=A0A2G2VSF5_CAPBA|nr:Elongation factor 1-beta 1 [Capsicum baccatum]